MAKLRKVVDYLTVPKQMIAFAAALIFTNAAVAQVTIDASISGDQGTAKSTVATPVFSTSAGSELLLAFISADHLSGANTTVTKVTGAGLTWVLVKRTNVQSGTAEIWRTFATSALSGVTVTATLSRSVASSLTVMSFRGVDTTGVSGSGAIGATGTGNAKSGAPAAALTTTRSGSLVVGVGNDFDNAIGRTPAPNQSLVHQFLAPVGDTYWVQMLNGTIPLSGTNVVLSDTAPSGDSYNLSICEILPTSSGGQPTFTLSGNISPLPGGGAVTLTLSGAATGAVQSDAAGNYSISNLANGTYTVTPSKSGYTFTPPSQTVTINGANSPGIDFTATAVQQTWSISGTIGPSQSIGVGTLLTLSGAASNTATADSSGNYNFTGLTNGSYTVTPSKTGYTFQPANRSITLNGANVTGINFTAVSAQSWTISGSISPAADGMGAIVILSGSPSAYATVDSSGNYSFKNLPNGTYAVTPGKTGYTFSPPSLNVVISGADSTGNSFAPQPLPPPSLDYPDLSDIIPPAQISVVGTGNNRVFQYTHDTFEGGTGPLEIQPVYNAASGNYQGIQHIYSHDSSGKLIVTQSIPVAGAFVFDPDHGHFHFPFASYGLYASNLDGSIGTLIAASTKVGFCIDNSFIYDSLLPNAGFDSFGSCSDPNTLRGLSIAAVDEYDQTDEGQAITIGALPDGIYWLRAIVDPNNYLAESDKSDNETDVQLSITGNAVQILQLVKPVLPLPPAITLTSPSGTGSISGIVQLMASTAVTGGSGVQFLVDGLPFGSIVPAAPYVLPWDTTKALNGTHWLAAQVTDSTGIIGTSPVVQVTVANNDTVPPTVQITSPDAGATVNATITIAANAAAQIGVPTVQFYVDNSPLGSPVTSPPYLVFWDTETSGDGTHVLSATATDQAGLTGNATPVSVTVDNSHPPNAIGIDVTVFKDGTGTMTTPSFSTSQDGELLLAFVGYDGPSGSPQTATVSGGGLIWTLLKRSNSQSGTAEIWAAKAGDPLSSATVISQPGVGNAYHGSLTVIAFTNAAGPGTVGQASAPSGAPDIFLPGVLAGNWVFAVGNDWDRAVARTPVSGQILVHQRVDTQTGDTYWVQSTAAPSTANALVDIHDNAPTNDEWNYAAVEVVATHQ